MDKSLKAVVVKTQEGKLELKVSFVFFHRDLVEPGETCLGGSRWKVDETTMEIVFYGSSDDFGDMPDDNWETLVKDFKSDWENAWWMERILGKVVKVGDTDINHYKFKYGSKTA